MLIMGCGCNKSRSTTKYRVKFNDGSSKDYATPGEANEERRKAGATAPVRAVQVNNTTGASR
ncbi:hypothetical protein [Nonomuraea rubra]|uniref:hypothetical protein n=1 Tax=Nonomuraea rubra TaxID=46180 RepID=UPI0033FAA1F8